jgi:nucleoside 2-deoxyribosyltransferase
LTIYLCGAMSKFYEEGRYDKAVKWRYYAKKYFAESNIRLFDPTDNSEMHFTYPEDYQKGVIYQNLTYLKHCDIVLVNLEHFDDSIGSIFEVTAAWLEHKPIIAFGKCDKWKSRPHFNAMITVQLNNVEDACSYILSMYRQKI